MNTKICIQCNNEKLLTEFYKHKKSPQGRSSKCKECERKYQLDRYHNPEIYTPQGSIEAKQKWREANKNKIKSYDTKWKEYKKEWRESNKDKIKSYDTKWRESNKDKIKDSNKKWRESNKDKINSYSRKRYHNDIEYKLRVNLRNRINQYLTKGNHKTSISFLGCSIEEYSLYLEKQFTEEMNWNNYGTYWEIDHTIPLSKGGSFHYTNTTPMIISENRSKGNRI